MNLYPRLIQSVASDLAREYAEISLGAAEIEARLEHPATVFNPTGGTRVSGSHLADLQRTIRAIAGANGYPAVLDRERQQRFDAHAAAALKSEMGISASEAAQTGVWSFIACVLLPDVVRWRYPGADNQTTRDRFIGGSRGIRNTFGRLWWRAHLLGVEGDFSLLHELGEDELVQITERPMLAGNPDVARLFAQRFLDHVRGSEEVSRSDLMRDAIKRLRRLMSFLSFDILTTEQLQDVIDRVLVGAAVAHRVPAGRMPAVRAREAPEYLPEPTLRSAAGEKLPLESIEEESSFNPQDMGAWERGVVDKSRFREDFQVMVAKERVRVSANSGDSATVLWTILQASNALKIRLRALASSGSESTLFAIVAAVFVHQEEFLEKGQPSLCSLTLQQIAEYLEIHESTVSRAKSSVYVQTPAGLLPLEYFFSPGVRHTSGARVSARAVRIQLREIVESEPVESPFSDEEIASRLAGRGFALARRTVAKYRDILGIPGAPGRKRLTEEAG